MTLDPATGIISGTPTDGGTSTFNVQCVVEGTGQTATKEFTITIENPLPTLTSLSPSEAVAGDGDFSLTVNGTNFVQSSVVRWNGSDHPTTYISANQLTAQISAVDIAAEGTANVTVYNPDPIGGTSNTLTFTILPPNQPPTVQAGGPYTVVEGNSVDLTGSGTDPDGDPLTYAWDLDNDGTFETPGQSAPFSAAALDGPDEKTVTVQVCDPSSACDTDSTTVTVTNANPIINGVTNNGPIDEGGNATITVDATDPAGPNDPLSFAFDCDGDSNFEVGPQSGATTTCPVADNGDFSVNVQVTDDDGGAATGSTTVTAHNVPPTVDAGADQTVYRNEVVSLLGHWIDPAGALDDPFTWGWDLDGDGSPDSSGSAIYGSAIAESTMFATEGVYNLGFEVADKDGGVGSDTVQIEVLNQPPDCTNAGPSVDIIWPPNHKFVPVDILGITDPEGDPASLTIDNIFQDEPVIAQENDGDEKNGHHDKNDGKKDHRDKNDNKRGERDKDKDDEDNGDGNFAPDGQGIGTNQVQVRAERAGEGNGRVYHIGFTVNDGHNGYCSGEVLVGVPHDKKDTPIDDGALYNSTEP